MEIFELNALQWCVNFVSFSVFCTSGLLFFFEDEAASLEEEVEPGLAPLIQTCGPGILFILIFHVF